jgi:hypothetical protein
MKVSENMGSRTTHVSLVLIGWSFCEEKDKRLLQKHFEIP